MTTTWPAYEGSVQTSWYPVWLVLTTRSPPAADGAPNATPGKIEPSSSASNAGPRSPMRGSTTALARGRGGTITDRSPSPGYDEPTGRRGSVGVDGHGRWTSFAGLTGPIRRPHRTGHERT